MIKSTIFLYCPITAKKPWKGEKQIINTKCKLKDIHVNVPIMITDE